MALKGVRVVEIAGLAPAPFAGARVASGPVRASSDATLTPAAATAAAPTTRTRTGMVLADFGADVVRVDRADVSFNTDNLARYAHRLRR